MHLRLQHQTESCDKCLVLAWHITNVLSHIMLTQQCSQTNKRMTLASYLLIHPEKNNMLASKEIYVRFLERVGQGISIVMIVFHITADVLAE